MPTQICTFTVSSNVSDQLAPFAGWTHCSALRQYPNPENRLREYNWGAKFGADSVFDAFGRTIRKFRQMYCLGLLTAWKKETGFLNHDST